MPVVLKWRAPPSRPLGVGFLGKKRSSQNDWRLPREQSQRDDGKTCIVANIDDRQMIGSVAAKRRKKVYLKLTDENIDPDNSHPSWL